MNAYYRHEWTGLTEPRVAQGALECFEELGRIRAEAVRATDGGRPTVRFHVNPGLLARTTTSDRGRNNAEANMRPKQVRRGARLCLLVGLACLVLLGQLTAQEPVHEGRTLSEWRRDLHAPSAEVRAGAILILPSFGPPAVAPIAHVLAHDPDPQVRFQAAGALLQMGPVAKDAVPALVRALGDPGDSTAPVSFVVMMGLARVGPDVVIPALVPALQDSNASVRQGAAFVLGQIGPAAKDAVLALVQTLVDPNPFVRSMAASALGQIGRAANAAIPALIQTLRDPEEPVRKAATDALSEIDPAAAAAALAQQGSRREVPALVRALRNPGALEREKAATDLGQLGSAAKDAVPALVQALGDADIGVRRQAAFALGQIGPEAKDAIPPLAQALRDVFLVRVAAAVALSRVGPDAVPALVQALEDQDDQVKISAIQALGRIGPGAKGAIPVLRELVARDPKLQDQAREALRKIESD